MERKVVMKAAVMISVLLMTIALMANLPIAKTGGTDKASETIAPQEYSISSAPPPTEWNRTYGGATDDIAHSAVQTADGGYGLSGYTTSFGAGAADFWLVKTDSAGNVQWNRTYGGASDDFVRSMVQTSDEGYVLAGETGSLHGRNDIWFVKTDSAGNIQWNRTYGEGGLYDSVSSVIQTADGGYSLSCSTGTSPVWYDFWLIKTDPAGNMEWNRTYGGANWDSTSSVVQTSDGGYALSGNTNSFGAGGSDFWLIKTDPAGNMEWNRTYGGASDDRVHSMVQTTDGGYALAGWTMSFGGGDEDFWLIKTDPAGNMEWNRTYGGGITVEIANSVVQTVDGGYAIAGWGGYFAWRDVWLVKTDSAGNIQWNQFYAIVRNEEAASVVQTSDGGYALGGYTGDYGDWDFLLIKLAGVHDVAVTNVSPIKTVVGRSYSMSINVTVDTQGAPTETFDVTLYALPQTALNETGWVGYWRFDEGTGTTAYDSSGNGNYGTLINGPTWTGGKVVGALSFDGSDDYVVASHSASLDIAGTALTLAAWVRPNSFSGGLGGYPQFVLKGDNSPSYFFGLTNDGMGFLRGGDAQAIAIITDDALTLGAWNHVAMTFDGSSFKFYKDGVLVHTGSYSGSISSVTQDLHIGGQPYYSNHFSGTIDEVKIYNRTLSADDIWNEYTRTGAGFTQTKTVTLENGASTTITFTWNTTGFTKGNYTISAIADTVPGEIDTADNTYIDGYVTIAMIGDLTGPTPNVPDGKVDIRDIATVAKHFGHFPPDGHSPSTPEYIACFNSDLTGPTTGVPDNKVDIRDIATVAKEFGKTDP